MIDNRQVARNIIYLRTQKNLSQQGLADLCSVTHQAVSKWENAIALPDMQTMLFLCKYFAVSMEDMLSLPLWTRNTAEAESVIQPETKSAEVQEEAASAEAADEAENTYAEEEARVSDEPASDDHPCLSLEEIVSLAPFANQGAIEHLIRAKITESGLEKADWSLLTALMPFVSTRLVDELIDTFLRPGNTNGLTFDVAMGIVPFASKETVERLFTLFLDEMDTAKMTAIAPFVSGSFLEKALRASKKPLDFNMLHGLAPFLPSDMLTKIILQNAGVQLPPQVNEQVNPSPNVVVPPCPAPIPQEETNASAPQTESVQQKKERVLMRIARKALEDGNVEWLEEHGDDLNPDELSEILAKAYESGMTDAVEALVENADSETCTHLAKQALEKGDEEMLEALLDSLDNAALQSLLEQALESGNWDMIDAISEHL